MEKKLVQEMNAQITKEFYSAYLYLSMVAYFDKESLDGCSHWMKMQAQEELIHGMKIFNYLSEIGTPITLGPIDKPNLKFSSVEDVFKKTLAHEKKVTASINNLYDLAQKAKDSATVIFLQWFVTEQIEEEKNPTDILAKLKHIGTQPAGILILDKELATRPQPVVATTASA
ncbi:MAG: ferritin [Candidatus Omnitrophica bacterium]|nr:ferritin [Candidatus Omnitrophota bacterium]